MSSLSDWLLSISPDTFVVLGGALLSWLGITKSGKAKHELRRTARTLLADLYRREVLGNPKLADPHYAQEYLDGRVWTQLANLGVKKTHAREVLVDTLSAEVIRAFQQENLRAALELLSKSAGTIDTNKVSGDIPQLGLPMEEVKVPDGSGT